MVPFHWRWQEANPVGSLSDTDKDAMFSVLTQLADATRRRDYDGVVDNRFDNGASVPVPAGTQIAGEDFGKLGCGSFHSFWWKR